MFEHFTTATDLFNFKLATALTMEHDSLDLLEDLDKAAMRSDLKELFREQAEQTRLQIANLQRCLTLVGVEEHRVASPASNGLVKEAKSLIGKSDHALVDATALCAALEFEHYEIAVYESLMIHAHAMDLDEVAGLLNENMQQEVAAARELKSASESIAQSTAQVTGEPDFEDPTGVNLVIPPYMPPSSM